MKTPEWAPGIWSGSEGMKIQAYDTLTGGSVQNTGVNAMTVSAVDMTLRTVTVDDAAGLAAGDLIYFNGAYANEAAGLHHILSNTGTLFGINAANYSLWTGNTHSVNGGGSAANLSFNEVTDAIDLAMEKGLDEDAVLLVNNRTWTDLMQDLAALRDIDYSYATAKVDFGHKALTFFTQNGKIDIRASIYVKEGFAYLFVPRHFLRVGSTDVTFNRPGQADSFFMDLENAAGYELRSYTDQALFCHSPGKQVLIDNITNTG